MSLEALAMAGVDHTECSINVEAWERGELELLPLHLLAEKLPCGNIKVTANSTKELAVDEDWLKQKVGTKNDDKEEVYV
ncbi:hypothetical protein Ancab_026320 [Ancistrocladus abbreviatus]